MIPCTDPSGDYDELRDELDAAYRRVLDSGWYIGGAEVEAFEREFAAVAESDHAVGVGNGLDAMTLALRAADIGPGDEVIVPSHTCLATWLAVRQAGADVVPVEVDRETLLLDADAARAAVGPRTAALLPVHLYGQPVEMDAVAGLASAHGLFVLEDAAQAHGARYRGRRVGSLGNAAGFSFYPTKNLGAFGDGGATTCADGALAHRVRRLRNYGSIKTYVHEEAGVNSRLDPLQAAFLRTKLPRLDAWNRRRAEIAGRYLAALSGVPGLDLPVVRPDTEPVWHIFAVRHARRDALAEHLRGCGVGTLVHYPTAAHLTGAFVDLGLGEGAYPVAEDAARRLLSLPMGPHLTDAQVDRVIEAVTSFSLARAA